MRQDNRPAVPVHGDRNAVMARRIDPEGYIEITIYNSAGFQCGYALLSDPHIAPLRAALDEWFPQKKEVGDGR